MKIIAPISVGELQDKISILEIKIEKITDQTKLQNVRIELDLLKELRAQNEIAQELFSELKQVNGELWDIEDEIRIYEKNKDFGQKFIDLARSVYVKNDRRFEIKNKINTNHNSVIVEEKSYEKY